MSKKIRASRCARHLCSYFYNLVLNGAPAQLLRRRLSAASAASTSLRCARRWAIRPRGGRLLRNFRARSQRLWRASGAPVFPLPGTRIDTVILGPSSGGQRPTWLVARSDPRRGHRQQRRGAARYARPPATIRWPSKPGAQSNSSNHDRVSQLVQAFAYWGGPGGSEVARSSSAPSWRSGTHGCAIQVVDQTRNHGRRSKVCCFSRILSMILTSNTRHTDPDRRVKASAAGSPLLGSQPVKDFVPLATASASHRRGLNDDFSLVKVLPGLSRDKEPSFGRNLAKLIRSAISQNYLWRAWFKLGAKRHIIFACSSGGMEMALMNSHVTPLQSLRPWGGLAAVESQVLGNWSRIHCCVYFALNLLTEWHEFDRLGITLWSPDDGFGSGAAPRESGPYRVCALRFLRRGFGRSVSIAGVHRRHRRDHGGGTLFNHCLCQPCFSSKRNQLNFNI